ncbi:MAG: ATP-binding protein [Candidatus Aminicenantes bacterium]|nr:ATP-binding protein [Candidatus Aminicenantes bacterium]
MKFYGRKKELETLQNLYRQTEESGRMTVLTGRRRVGKTMLALEFARTHKFIYLFAAKKSELLLCLEYIEEIKKVFSIPVIGEVRTFKDIFSLLLEISRKERFTLIVDEFQEFYNINPAVYSEIQHLWDLNKNHCRLNVIFIGSIYSLVHKIFENSKEPLFQRADRVFHIKPFKVDTISEILSDYGCKDKKTLFDFYLFTGGVPRYIDILVKNSVFSYEQIMNFLLDEYSPFINEGKNLLIEEFGKEYGAYFSILELIAAGKTARSEIESIMERQVGGHLERLENDYAVISKHKPIDAKPNSRIQKYSITDNFLNFWFRFIYRYRSAVETGNFAYIKKIIDRDYNVYSRLLLEAFFKDLFAGTQLYNRIGSYWEKGNLNEIDLVAINDIEKIIVIAEIKLNKSRIRLEALKKKSQRLLAKYGDYTPRWLALGLEDAEEYLFTGKKIDS